MEEPPDADAAVVGRVGGRAAEADGVVTVPAGPGSYLVLRGRTLPASERRVLAAFAAHVGSAVERARLAEAAAEVEPVKAADRMRTALLRAVGHDLRTPLAAGWAAVTSLRSRDVDFSAQDRDELLATADASMARLNRLVENLLDLSRLQAGVLTLNLRATTLEEVLPAALDALPVDAAEVDVRDFTEIPEVLADPPLLERVIANLVGNAARHTPAGAKVLVTARRMPAGWSCASSTGVLACRPQRCPWRRTGRGAARHGSGSSSPSSASATPTTPPVSASVWRSPVVWPRRWTALSSRRTLRAAV